MRAAVIDIGTNTFNLIIGQRNGDYVEQLKQERIPVKLGEGGIEKGYISFSAFTRGITALKQYRVIIDKFGISVNKVFAVATSATRSALNGDDFVAEALDQTGITIQVIDGDREAELIYKGVKLAMPGNGRMLAMDIGGGSTEYIIGEGDKILWKHSTDLGVSRLFGMFNPSDPYTAVDMERIGAHMSIGLAPLKEALINWPCEVLVGSSGSFETFAAMLQKERGEASYIKTLKTFDFTTDEMHAIHEWLIKSNRIERELHGAIAPMRVDLIGLGSLLTWKTVDMVQPLSMHMSSFALREGLMHEVLMGGTSQKTKSPKSMDDGLQ